jgi:PAS domain S-box-containing protein
VHPDDRARFTDVWQNSIRVGESFEVELRLWSQIHEQHRWHLISVRPHSNSAEAIARWVGTCQDFHDRRIAKELLSKSEARLKSVIKESPVGVIILNAEGQSVYYNRKCAELRGHEVDLSSWAEALHPDDRQRIVRSSMEAVERGVPWSDIYRFTHPGGRTVWVSARTVPIRSDSELFGFVRTLEDITELKTIEENLRQANQELRMHSGRLEHEVQERTAKVRDTLAELDKLSYSIVHDMRAPLRAMQGFANVLLQEYASKLDKQGNEFLERIAAAALRQDKLIQDVLVYHSYVRNEFPLAPVNLDQVVSGIVETYANLQPPTARVEIHRPLGWALAHETLLTQSVSALLDNAAKFVPPGVKPEIIVSAEQTPNEVKLWIRDNGIGIAPDLWPRLFDIFYTFHLHHEYSGTGIGLPLAKKALEKMQGSIGVESELGQGSRFWISMKRIPTR